MYGSIHIQKTKTKKQSNVAQTTNLRQHSLNKSDVIYKRISAVNLISSSRKSSRHASKVMGGHINYALLKSVEAILFVFFY